jgi:hypothetical protein
MTNVLLSVLLLAIVVLIGTLWWRRRDPRRATLPEEDRLDTIAAWPPTATRVLGKHDRLAYLTLTRALPDHMILAQVPLSRFLRVPTRHSHAEWLRRLGNQCVDLLVCDRASRVIGVVIIQAPADQINERVRKRSLRMARSLKVAGVPLHVWTEGALPSLETVRHTILPEQPASHEVLVAPAPSSVQPRASAPTPFDDAERDSDFDEFIELNEPPPTTWYDDFDSGPAPLQKPPRR